MLLLFHIYIQNMTLNSCAVATTWRRGMTLEAVAEPRNSVTASLTSEVWPAWSFLK